MKKFLEIKKEIKEPNNQLEKINIFYSSILNLKKIKNNFDEINNCFNYYFNFLINIKEENKLIDNSLLLLKEIKKQSNKEMELFLSELTENTLKLNEYNLLITDKPTYCKYLTFNIKNFYIDNFYKFNITIDYLDSNNKFKQIEKPIFPSLFANTYKELIIFKDNIFKSIFPISSNKEIKFYNIKDNKEVNINYLIDELGYIIINKDNVFEDIYVEYNLTKESNTLELNGEILKIYLNTNFKNNNLKYFNMVNKDEL